MSKLTPQFKHCQLYHFRGCPFCIKVRFALWLMRVKLVLKNISTHAAHKTELVAGGGKKQVPCLRIEDDSGESQWLYESADIIHYIKSNI